MSRKLNTSLGFCLLQHEVISWGSHFGFSPSPVYFFVDYLIRLKQTWCFKLLGPSVGGHLASGVPLPPDAQVKGGKSSGPGSSEPCLGCQLGRIVLIFVSLVSLPGKGAMAVLREGGETAEGTVLCAELASQEEGPQLRCCRRGRWRSRGTGVLRLPHTVLLGDSSAFSGHFERRSMSSQNLFLATRVGYGTPGLIAMCPAL